VTGKVEPHPEELYLRVGFISSSHNGIRATRCNRGMRTTDGRHDPPIAPNS
jgi:hypothetical protein